jgi:sulfate permease, SulP family
MRWAFSFRPKLVDALKNYSAHKFCADVVAGLTVGVVALPLAMAFAIASGVKPEAGIFTAVVAGFIISALGGSRVAIGGPTGAFVIIVYGIYQQYGVNNLVICTIMAGVILLIMGFAGMGTMIKFIPYPVTIGFTCGIAVLIASTQIKDFFGLQIAQVMPANFLPRMLLLARNGTMIRWPTLALALASLAAILFWPKKLARKVPGSFVALVFGTTLVWLFQSGMVPLSFRLNVETIGSKFGGIPQSLPPFHWPAIDWHNIPNLIQPATTIALLAAIESLLCCVVADGMIDDRHDSNQELLAQGFTNILSPLLGGIPATSAIARTTINIKNGGQTPVAGIIHAATLLLILLVAAPLAKYVPLATLSAVLMVVCYNMGEWHQFVRLAKWPKSDAAVFLTTFALTVVIDLTVAVEVGMILAAILFIKRIAETTRISATADAGETEDPQNSLAGRQVPEGVLVFRLFGAFFFGAADKLETALQHARQEPEVLILRMREVLAMDATGLNALEDLHERLRSRGKYLILCGPHTQPMFAMSKAGFLDRIGRENICGNVDESLVRAREILVAQAGKLSREEKNKLSVDNNPNVP